METNLNRGKLVEEVLSERGDALVVTGLGAPTYDVAACGDRDENFYLWGGMGGAMMVGLGLALAQLSRRVLVISGDGEALMGAGAFATIAHQNPSNFSVLILDNGAFGETGMQKGLTSNRADLCAMASGAGIEMTFTAKNISDINQLNEVLWTSNSAAVAVAKIDLEDTLRFLPPRNGAHLHNRFRRALNLPLLADAIS